MQAIGIDIGTTSVCGVVLDVEKGQVVRSLTKNSEAFIEGCAPWEKIQSVEKIISTAMSILEEFVCEDTAVIGVTGQMHGIVYTDEKGQAVSPLYTWQDERGNLPYEDTTYAGYLKSFAGYGNVTDFYNRVNGIRPSEAVSYCTIHDYFVMHVCGLTKPLMHTSDAASFGCYDIAANRFSYDCDVAVTGDYTIAGTYKGIPVSVAIGDNQASVFSTLTDPNKILINVGTGSQISVISETIVKGENIEVRPYFENQYLVVGAALCGGRAYSVLKNFFALTFGYVKPLTDDEVYGVMNEMLKAGADTLNVDTRFAGTRQDNRIRGSITGITTENFTPEGLTRGVLAGMMNELYGMYEAMNLPRNGIIGSGNGIRKNAALVRIAEEKFDSEMQIPAHTEEASVGAALFALIAGGIFADANEAQKLIHYI